MNPIRSTAATGWSDRVEESELRSLLNEAPIGVYRTAPDGRLLYLNQAAMRLLGYEGPVVEGLDQDAFHPSYDRNELRQRLERDGTVRNLEATWRRRDGSVIHVRENARAVRDERGAVVHFEGTIEDITTLKETEEAVREHTRRAEARARLSQALAECELEPAQILSVSARLVAEALGDACIVRRLTPDKKSLRTVALHHVDPQAHGLLKGLLQEAMVPNGGVTARVLSSGLPQLITHANASEMRRATPPALRPYLDTIGIQSIILAPLRVRGQVIGTLEVMRDVPGQPYSTGDFGLVEDLAERASLALDRAELFATLTDELQRRAIAETEVRTMATDLERRVDERTAELMDAYRELESFSYTVSHDLRAPLRAIDGFTQALFEEYGRGLDKSGQDLLLRVRAAAKRMGKLIEDLLDLSRVARADLRIEPLDLSAMADEILTSLRQREPGRALAATIQPGLSANGDPHLMRLVMENLLENAWKFSSKKPRTVIEFGATSDAEGQRSFHVRDQGSGFDPSQAHLLFRPFQRLHATAQFPGTGIGLATVRRIIQRHGGRIWAEGAPDEGATFSFTMGERTGE